MTTSSAQSLQDLLDRFTQGFESGGVHMPPEGRFFLLSLALLLKAQDILETGYDAAFTTEALLLSKGKVTGIDNESEYANVKPDAKRRMGDYPNCELINTDALEFLQKAPDNSYDLIFVDDHHDRGHVTNECLEIRRILKPGGIAVFHDTVYWELWLAIEEVFSDWQRINLPCVSQVEKRDMGLGLVRRPIVAP